MNITFRPVTEQDLDFVFALPEIEAIKPHLGWKREWCDSITQGKHLAVDEETGDFIMGLPQQDRLDSRKRYLLVCANGIVVMKQRPSGDTNYPVLYVSPALAGQLDSLIPLLREVFSRGGEYLRGKPASYEVSLGKEACFVIESDKGE